MRRFLVVFALMTMTHLSAGTLWAGLEGVTTGQKRLEQVRQRVNNVNTAQLQDILKKDPTTLIVDVRTPSEVNLLGGTIRSARNTNIPMGWLEFRIWDWARDRDQKIIVYCGINQGRPAFFQAKKPSE